MINYQVVLYADMMSNVLRILHIWCIWSANEPETRSKWPSLEILNCYLCLYNAYILQCAVCSMAQVHEIVGINQVIKLYSSTLSELGETPGAAVFCSVQFSLDICRRRRNHLKVTTAPDGGIRHSCCQHWISAGTDEPSADTWMREG